MELIGCLYQFSMPFFIVMIVSILFCQSFFFTPIYLFWGGGFEFVGVVIFSLSFC